MFYHGGSDEDDVRPLLQVQAQLLIPRESEALKFNTSIGPPVPPRFLIDQNKLIISSPVVTMSGRIGRNRLPSGVRPDDKFGVLQTVYRAESRAWYVFIPGVTTLRPGPLRPRSGSAPPTVGPRSVLPPQPVRRASISHLEPSGPIPYNAYTQWMRGMAADRGEHPFFYGNAADFEVSEDRARLFGVSRAPSDSIGIEEVDKPQHPFPIRTPQNGGSFGVIDTFAYDFEACAWFVAMRGSVVIHYFRHVEWRVSLWGAVRRHGAKPFDATVNGGATIVSEGDGKGSRVPVIGGISANEAPTVTEWSRPFHDPQGIC